MKYDSLVRHSSVAWLGLAVAFILVVAPGSAQQTPTATPPRAGVPAVALPDGPVVVDTAEHRIRVVPVTKGLSHPWGLAFLPDGSILVTERAGRLRIIRNGVLDPQPISGVPQVLARGLQGLMDIALHPRFAENKLVYLAYSKPGENGLSTTALARGRFDGVSLTDVRDIFVATPWESPIPEASRITFGRDGILYMTVGGAINAPSSGMRAQDPNDYRGKVLRLRDDGSVPSDNPFVGRAGYRPEIYSMGHRNQLGLAINPVTGALWAHENGPQGGDELNIILPGKNYGWPVISSFSREYSGQRIGRPWREDMEQPLVVWLPSIAPSGLMFYNGERFPKWKGNVFVGSMTTGRMPHSGHVERIVFNEREEELRREWLLTEFRQRIKDVRQGPDGLVYVLTDEDEAALLRIEPTQ